MHKLSKADMAALDTHAAALVAAYEALGAAVERFNATMAQAWTAVEEAEAHYNGVVDEWNAWRLQVGADGRAYVDERSEKWQESDKGQAYEAWIEPYEDERLFERSALSIPEPAEVDIEDPADDMSMLATEPD